MKKCLTYILLIFIALFNYTGALFIYATAYIYFPKLPYIFGIALPWLVLGLLCLFYTYKSGSLYLNLKRIILEKQSIILCSSLIIIGLGLFVIFDITKYFHSVRYPFFFYLITPFVEETIFRGFIFGVLEKINKKQALVVSAVLFGLHHLQYSYPFFTKFTFFQVTYTIVLGLLLGKIRKSSGSIYIGLILHIFINLVSVYL